MVSQFSAVDIIALVVSFAALGFTIYTYIHSIKLERKKNSIDAYIELQGDLYFLNLYPEQDLMEFISSTKCEEYKTLGACIAKIEIFATGVITKVYDFDVVYNVAHGYLDGVLKNKIESVLDYKKECSRKEYYQNTRKLLQKMQKKSC